MESTVNTEVEDVFEENELIDDSVPIREISRVTGVNTVTLRAWERRYGLLIPQRTTKGHRLYSRADIERVKEIQLWLGRGLAISKVKALLADEQRGNEIPAIDSIWIQLAQQIQAAITAFNRNQLERLIEDTFALYPVEMIADFLLAPLLQELQGDEPGKPARRAFFNTVIQEYIHASQSRQRQAARGEKILVLAVSEGEGQILSHVLNYGLLVNQHRAEFLGYLPVKESLLCAEAMGAEIVVIPGGDTIAAGELQLHLTLWRERLAIPVVLSGNAARLFRALHFEPTTGIYLCDSQQQVLAMVNQILTDESSL
ncbi:MAG: MerR family transcriptional regulator [Cellvibrio sp.]|uniref:MerR family transcriptional regulator n=1 Tax=Cellvibrio sp. TaxID=1965322 RepID=UPI0031B50E79